MIKFELTMNDQDQRINKFLEDVTMFCPLVNQVIKGFGIKLSSDQE